MSRDYQGRTSAQRFTEERFGTVYLSDDGECLASLVSRRVVGRVVLLRRARTGRVTGRVRIGYREHAFSQADADSPVWIAERPVLWKEERDTPRNVRRDASL
jgi:hypothetical protein